MSHDYDPPASATPPPAPAPPKPRPVPPPPPAEAASSVAFPAILGVIFLGVMVAAWFVKETGAASPPPEAIADGAPAPGPAPAPTAEDLAPAPTPAVATADDLKALRDDLAALTVKVDAMPKPEPPPAVDLKPIEAKIDGLAGSVEGMGGVPKAVEELSGKLAQAEEKLAAVTAEVASLRESTKATIKPTASPDAAAPVVDMAAMNSAVDLFRAGKYAEALDAFKKLPADDARVLYYTALANGQVTRSWTGETEKLALEGVAREKAGSPATPTVDAAFADLTDQQGKAWLAFYRAKAK